MGIGRYDDHPDGQQCLQKVLAVSKVTALLGITGGTFDVVMYTKPQGYHGALVQYMKSLVPVMASGATFAAITCAATTFRGKDDHYNYMLGGASAGSIIGVWARSFKVGVPTAVFMAVAAAVYKDSRLNGWDLFPVPPARDMGSIDYRKFDFTLTKDVR